LASLLTFFYSGSFHMLGVNRFSETLLEAVEDELKVRELFSYIRIRLSFSPSRVVLVRQVNSKERDLILVQR